MSTRTDPHNAHPQDVILAAVLLTRLPLPRLPQEAFSRSARAVWAYPIVGAGRESAQVRRHPPAAVRTLCCVEPAKALDRADTSGRTARAFKGARKFVFGGVVIEGDLVPGFQWFGGDQLAADDLGVRLAGMIEVAPQEPVHDGFRIEIGRRFEVLIPSDLDRVAAGARPDLTFEMKKHIARLRWWYSGVGLSGDLGCGSSDRYGTYITRRTLA